MLAQPEQAALELQLALAGRRIGVPVDMGHRPELFALSVLHMHAFLDQPELRLVHAATPAPASHHGAAQSMAARRVTAQARAQWSAPNARPDGPQPRNGHRRA